MRSANELSTGDDLPLDIRRQFSGCVRLAWTSSMRRQISRLVTRRSSSFRAIEMRAAHGRYAGKKLRLSQTPARDLAVVVSAQGGRMLARLGPAPELVRA